MAEQPEGSKPDEAKNRASRLMNPGSAGILPALLSRMSHTLEFIVSWTARYKEFAFISVISGSPGYLLSGFHTNARRTFFYRHLLFLHGGFLL